MPAQCTMRKVVVSIIPLCFLFLTLSLPGKTCIEKKNKTDKNEAYIFIATQADSLFCNLHFSEAERLYRILIRITPAHNDQFYHFVNRLVESLWWQYDFDESEKIARNYLPGLLSSLGEDHPQAGQLFLNLGILAFLTSSSALPEEYFLTALDIFQNRFGVYHSSVAINYEWLGTFYESRSDKKNAYMNLKKSLQIWQVIRSKNDPDLANVHRYLGLYYKRFAQHDSAMICYQKALSLFDKKYGPNNFQSVKCLNNQCDILEEHNNERKAMQLYREAEKRLNNASGDTKMGWVMTLYNLAEHHYLEGNVYHALSYIRQVFPFFFRGYTDTSVLANPKCIDSVNHYFVKLLLVTKSRFLRDSYYKDKIRYASFLPAILQCDSLVVRINEISRIRIINYNNLLAYLHDHSRIYYDFVSDALEQYKRTGEEKYFCIALGNIEKNRNLTLPGNRDFYIENFGYTTGIRNKLDSFQKQINRVTGQLNKYQSHGQERVLEKKLRMLKIDMDQYYYGLCQDFHVFQEKGSAKYELRLEDIRKKLDRKTMILQFFEQFPDYYSNPERILLMAITKENIGFHTYAGDTLVKLAAYFNSLVANPSSSESGIVRTGDSICQMIFGPFREMIKDKNSLLIIPSPDTWMLSFECLSFTENNNANQYLLYKYKIYKENSLYTWLNTAGSDRDPVRVLTVSPTFNRSIRNQIALLSKRDGTELSLPGSLQECSEIRRIFPTYSLTGKEATRDRFKSLAPRYPVLHISTHGISLNNKPGDLNLAFYSGPETPASESYIGLHEILNMNLNSSLVVLSACKSALGEKNKSEGGINLAWAFRQAGAKSVVVSLWDVNDYASSQIMPSFYRHMADGITKPEALRMAKLDFLNDPDNPLKHPYFWACFDFIGDDQSLTSKSTVRAEGDRLPPVLISLILIFLGLILIFFRNISP